MTVAPHPQPGLVRRVRGALTRREWARAGGLAAAILALHVIGWGTLLFVVVPQHFDLGSQGAFGVGLGVTAARSGNGSATSTSTASGTPSSCSSSSPGPPLC
jgi:hypothetical protein